jgi:hypothetical protein
MTCPDTTGGFLIAMSIIGLAFVLIAAWFDIDHTQSRVRLREMGAVARDKRLCRQIAIALEIPDDQGDPAEYVMFALREHTSQDKPA